MKRLWLLCAPAGLLLSSATPPPATVVLAAIEPENVLDLYPMCPEGRDCTELAAGVPEQQVLERSEAGAAEASSRRVPSPPRGADDAGQIQEASAAPTRDDEGLKILVSIPLQKAYVFQDGELLATSPVSTGKRGHETPAGTFRILQKKVHHRSNRYANAPMPYMQRLTSYGIALHAGSLPGYPASHGCIRLPRHFAKKLYGLTDMGTRVTITRQRPKSADEALTLA